MKTENYVEKLDELYKKAVEQGNLNLALELLERKRIAS